MSKYIAVSLEDGYVKVAHGDIRRGNTLIGKTFTLSFDEFDRYLETTRENEFIVVGNFENIYQDIISIPPADEKYLRTLLELEIRKRAPELKEFSFFYEELQDVQKEGKRSKDVFVFAVTGEDVENVLERFNRHDKIVSTLFPAVLPLARFLRIDEATETNEKMLFLGVIDHGASKTMFLAREGKLCFVRVAQSDGKGIGGLDVENINMTIAYCRQVLRLNPSSVVYLGGTGPRDTELTPVVPVAEIAYPDDVQAFVDGTKAYVVPVAAVTHGWRLKAANLLPSAYQGLYARRKIMAYGITFLLLFALLGVGYISIMAADVISTKREITRVRQEIAARQGVIEEYERTTKELKRLEPLITFLGMADRAPDVQKTMAKMNILAINNVYIKSVNMHKDEKNEVILQIEGAISAGDYRELQGNYERLLAVIKDAGGLEIVSQGLDLRAKTFRVDMRWKM